MRNNLRWAHQLHILLMALNKESEVLHCVFSKTNQKITESYTIWRHKVDAERLEVTPGVEFYKVSPWSEWNRGSAADTKE